MIASASRNATKVLLLAVAIGCAAGPTPPPATPGHATPVTTATRPRVVRVEPMSGNAGATAKDPGFAALEEELQRAMTELGTHGQPPPYFMAYEVHDEREVTISAQYGALMRSNDERKRVLDVDVRVGDPKLDSTHTLRDAGFDFASMMARPIALPLDASAAALRAVAWDATDKRYKRAVERYLKVKTQQQVKTAEDDSSDDFSREAAVTFIEKPASLAVDVPEWEARIRRLSARFRAAPELHDANVVLQARAGTRFLTNSERSSLQTADTHVRVFMQASTRAEDGMELDRFEAFDAASFEQLPDEATMAATADRLIAELRALRTAPLAEPYAGPAILEGKAAGVFFHEIFGHRVEGHRQKGDEEGQTFAKKIGEPVMPELISVYDDPTLRRLGDVDLNGFYRFDDEAVPAQRAELVDKGVLRGFLMSRSPTRGFNRSNGHGRRQAGHSVVARQANLVVEPAASVPTSELRARLIEEARRQHKPFGLLFKDISGGFTFTQRAQPQAFKVSPILVYRVFVDGRPDELIRGADIVGTPLSSLTKILAAGDDYQTFNGSCGAESGWVPVSATSPSLLVQQLEIERKEKGDKRPPLLAAPSSPPVTGAVPPSDAVVRQAMTEELSRAMTELRLPKEPAPYYIAYSVDDVEVAQARATFGAVTSSGRDRMRMLRTAMRVGDASFDNSNFADRSSYYGGSVGTAQLSIEDDLASLRRDLWLRTDESYKHAVQVLAKKRAAATSQAQADDDVPDFAAEPAVQIVDAPELQAPEPAVLAALAQRVSSVFQGYPTIATSSVSSMHVVARRRFLSSEGAWSDQRRAFTRVEVFASTQADDGMRLKDSVVFHAATPSELPSLEAIEQSVRRMADGLSARRDAVEPSGGPGVVVFEGLASAQIVKQLLGDQLSGTPPPSTSGGEGREQPGALSGRIGQKIASDFLSVIDDPLAVTGPDGARLLGSYRADAEGSAARKVSVVEGGVLKNLLMSRIPSKSHAQSNGHGRGDGSEPRGRIANLIVTAKRGLPRTALLAKAAALAKSAGGHAYVVRLIDDPVTAGGFSELDVEDMADMFMGRRGDRPAPRKALVAFRLEDGKEIAVRGLTLEGLSLRSLKDIAAAGRDATALSFFDEGAPASIVSPALLFSDVEVRPQSGSHKRPPLYSHPHFAPATSASVASGQ